MSSVSAWVRFGFSSKLQWERTGSTVSSWVELCRGKNSTLPVSMESSRLTLHTQGFRSDPMSHGTQAGCSLSLVSLQLLLKSESYWHVKSFGVRWWDCLSARVIVLETEPQWGCGSSRIKRCHCKALTSGHMSCGADINTISTSIFEPKGQKIRSAPPHPVFHGMILPMLPLVQEACCMKKLCDLESLKSLESQRSSKNDVNSKNDH